MGFPVAWQSKTSHDGIVAKQDNDIRLFETIRRCLLQRVKCDRDYATAISNNVSQIGLKIEKIEDFSGNQMFQVWRKVMEETEEQSKLIRNNANQLESLCVDRLLQLLQEKKKLKKQCVEEHLKISFRFTQVTEELTRKKSEYQKQMENYKLLRLRFEDHYVKSGRAGRKLDDVREKFQKACKKLHLAHNEYVIIIHEAVEIEKDYRSVLLPKLLESHQVLQQNFVSKWKTLLFEALKYIDLTSEKHAEIQNRINSIFEEAINSKEDYSDLVIMKNKSSAVLPVVFRFDDQLIEEAVGKLQPNKLTVDNLTVEWLRNRIVELEASMKECQAKKQSINENIDEKITILNCRSDGIRSNTSNDNGQLESNRPVCNFNLNLVSLTCEERQKSKLIDVIRSALNEVVCEELLPSGCEELKELEAKKIDNREKHSDSFHMSLILRKSNEFIKLRNPFMRKSKPISDEVVESESSYSSKQTISNTHCKIGEPLVIICILIGVLFAFELII